MGSLPKKAKSKTTGQAVHTSSATVHDVSLHVDEVSERELFGDVPDQGDLAALDMEDEELDTDQLLALAVAEEERCAELQNEVEARQAEEEELLVRKR